MSILGDRVRALAERNGQVAEYRQEMRAIAHCFDARQELDRTQETFRDRLAMAALQGRMGPPETVAAEVYRVADAMLKARESEPCL